MTAKTEQQQGREELFDEMQRMFDSACAGVRTEAITGNAVKEAFWRGQRCTALCALLLATQTSALAEQQQGREGELLPCPFCGMIAQQIGPAQYRLWHADDCKLSPCNPEWFKTQREIDNWNRRVTALAGEGESSGTKLNRQTAKQIESDVASGECQIEDIGGLVFTHLQIAQKRGEVLIKRRLSEMVNGRATAPTEKGAGEI